LGAESPATIRLSNVNNVTFQNVAIKGAGSILIYNSSYNGIFDVRGLRCDLYFSDHNEISNISGNIEFQDSSNSKVNNSNIGGLSFENSNHNSILNKQLYGSRSKPFFF